MSAPRSALPEDTASGAAPQERVDAARNRVAVLEAAQRLFARDGVAGTSMDAIAREARVGKGTLFRRFGDRASLITAILQEPTAAFQEAIIRGPAPLGPGAHAGQRLIAFGHARLALLERYADLMADAEAAAGTNRLRSPIRASYRTHLMALLQEGAPDVDADLAADTLLDELGAELYLIRTHERGVSQARLRDHWETLARGLIAN